MCACGCVGAFHRTKVFRNTLWEILDWSNLGLEEKLMLGGLELDESECVYNICFCIIPDS